MLALVMWTAMAAAAAEPAWVFQPEPPAVVARFVENMRDNITMGSLPDGTRLQPETPAERAQPILPPELAQRVFDRGLLSGEIEACGGDAEAMSYAPFMAKLRARTDLTPKQVAFAGLLHNAAREQRRSLDPDCTDAQRRAIAATLKTVQAGD